VSLSPKGEYFSPNPKGGRDELINYYDKELSLESVMALKQKNISIIN
jgi:hypothetical protein